MIVVGSPAAGDILQAQKPLPPQKEIHGKGFEEIFKDACERLAQSQEGDTKNGVTRVVDREERIGQDLLAQEF